MSICILIACVVFTPLMILFVVFRRKENVDEEKYIQTFACIFENQKINTKGQILFRIWFCFRRILFIVTPLCLIDTKSIQIIIICLINLTNTIYIHQTNLFIQRFDKYMDTFNEFIFSMTTYGMIFFTDFVCVKLRKVAVKLLQSFCKVAPKFLQSCSKVSAKLLQSFCKVSFCSTARCTNALLLRRSNKKSCPDATLRKWKLFCLWEVSTREQSERFKMLFMATCQGEAIPNLTSSF